MPLLSWSLDKGDTLHSNFVETRYYPRTLYDRQDESNQADQYAKKACCQYFADISVEINHDLNQND